MIDWSKVETAEARAAKAKAAAQARVLSALEDAAAALTGPIPQAERDSWTKKEIAARAFLAGEADATQAAVLKCEAALRGVPVEAVAQRIIAKADTFALAAATIAGLRGRWLGRIAAATSAARATEIGEAAVREIVMQFAQ